MANAAQHIFRNARVSVSKQFEEQNSNDERFHRVLAEISNGNLDSDGHTMDSTTLVNFGRESKAGVQVKDSHSYRNGFGRTFDGKYDKAEDRVTCGLRLSRGYPLTSDSYQDSDTFIKAIIDGVIEYVSIGAYGGELICNICDESMYRSRDCYHWPLIVYRITDDKGVIEEITCTANYINGHLREVSLVDKGATPDAGILARLDDHLQKGIISDSDLYLVKGMYGVPSGAAYSFGEEVTNGKPQKTVDDIDKAVVDDPAIDPVEEEFSDDASATDDTVVDKVDAYRCSR